MTTLKHVHSNSIMIINSGGVDLRSAVFDLYTHLRFHGLDQDKAGGIASSFSDGQRHRFDALFTNAFLVVTQDENGSISCACFAVTRPTSSLKGKSNE